MHRHGEGPVKLPEEQDAAPELVGLLQAAGGGDAGAWREIVGRYSRRVFALAQSRCRDPDVSEEITQSVLATVALKIGAGSYAELGRFESWLFRVTMNRIRDHVRRSRRRPVVGDGNDLLDRHEAKEASGADGATLARLRWALDQLNEQDREVIDLRHHGDLTFKQMADMLEEPVGTLLARHHRALRKLKELIEARDARERTRKEVER